MREKGTRKHGCYDKIIFKKIRAKFGGNIRLLMTGSAPIAPEVMTFWQCALSIHVSEVYGQTEIGCVTMTQPEDFEVGFTGGIVPTCKMRLRDCPELEYLHTD